MRWSLALPLAFGFGCAAPISTELRELEPAPKLHKIAVLQFAEDPASGGSVGVDASAIVTARVLEAMTRATQLEIVPPGETARAASPGQAASGQTLRRQFGVDAVLSGVVRRYVDRVGGPGGAFKPASVWFTMELRSTEGALIWSGSYEETQHSLAEDLGSIGRAWERGFTWVTASELAGYGARQLASALAEDTAPWS